MQFHNNKKKNHSLFEVIRDRDHQSLICSPPPFSKHYKESTFKRSKCQAVPLSSSPFSFKLQMKGDDYKLSVKHFVESAVVVEDGNVTSSSVEEED